MTNRRRTSRSNAPRRDYVELRRTVDSDQDCPELCSHGGKCEAAREAIQEAEMYAEGAYVRALENRIDPEAEADLRMHEALHPDGYRS